MADISAFYRDGLRLANHETQRKRAREIFDPRRFPGITEQLLAEAMREDETAVDDHRAFVVLDREEFLETAGQYLIYGSEFLCGVAAALSGPITPDYRQEPNRYGVPYVLELEVPFSFSRSSRLTQSAGEFRDAWQVSFELATSRPSISRLPFGIPCRQAQLFGTRSSIGYTIRCFSYCMTLHS